MSFGAATPFAVAGDIISNSAMMAQQAQYNKEAESKAFARSLEAQSLAPQNYVSGLRSAGLPVGLALKGAFQTSSSPSPMPVTSHPVSVSGAMAADAALQQASLVSSQVEKLDAETEALEIKNRREKDADFTIDANLRAWCHQMAKDDPDYADFYNTIANSPTLLSMGTLNAISAHEQRLMTLDDSDLKFLSNQFYKLVFSSQINNGIADVVADVPRQQRLQFFADLSKTYTEISKLLTDTDLDKSKILETLENIKKIRGDVDDTYYKNFARLVANGDYLSAGISLFGNVMESFGAGAGVALGARVSKGAKSAKAAPSSGSGSSSAFPK